MEEYIPIMSLNEISTKKANGIFWVIIGLLALGGAALLWYSTPFGMALVNDSVNYIDGARNLLAGHGYSRILGNGNYAAVTNFPPFYSIILAGILLLGVDGITATWWLGVVFYALNLMLIGWLGRKITGSSVFGILSVVLFLLSEPFLNFHTFALTEPVFLFTFFLTIIFAILFLEKQKWYWIVLSGFFASLTYLTRYIGASLFVTVIASIIVFLPGWKKKIQYGLIFLAGAMPAVIAWTVRNIIQTGNATNRQTMWHAIPIGKSPGRRAQFLELASPRTL